ncbi:MAG: hypothetical protein ACXVRV_14445 [Gaiellaceae bacterium]
MRIELSDGEVLDLSDHEARTLYETLLERARQRGAISAAGKLRPALAWSSGAGTKVALDQFETGAVQSVREDKRPG